MHKHSRSLRPAVLPLLLASAFAHADQAIEDIHVTAHQGSKIKTNVVTVKSANQSTESDLRGLLREEPAINFSGGSGTSQYITIRGLGQDQIDLKIDGASSDAQIFHHQGRFLTDPSLVKIISVQKGTGSASAGIGATAGSIVMKTLDAKDLLRNGKNFGFKINGGGFTNKGWLGGATVFGKAGMFDGLVSFNHRDEKGYEDGNGHEVALSDLESRSILAKAGLNFSEDQRLGISFRQERTEGTRNLREEFDQSLSEPLSSALKRMDPRNRVTTQNTANLEWEGRNMGFISRGDANVFMYDIEREDGRSLTGREGATDKIETRGANLNLDSQIPGGHVIKYGINYRTQEGIAHAPLIAGQRNQEKDEYGIYAEGIWNFNPVTLTTGLRYDHFDFKTGSQNLSASDGNLNPSIGVIWDVTDGLSLNTSLNYASRSPRFFEVTLANNLRGKPMSYEFIGGKELKAEQSRNFEIGFNYKPNSAWTLDGTYFTQKIDDLQTINRKIKPGVVLMGNDASLKNRGYEFNAAYRWRGLTARAGVAYQKPTYSQPVDALGSIDSNHALLAIGRTWTTGLSYRFAHPKLEIGWRGRFVQRRVDDVAPSSARGAGGGSERKGYGVNDIYVNWQPLSNDSLNVNFAINNIGNKFYRSHSQRIGDNSLPEAGRDIRLTANYTF